MSTIGNTYVTLADFAKRLDPNQSIAEVANVLSKANPIMQDIPWVEGNLPTGHRFTSATALPTGTWRKLNQGYDATKASTDQVDEVCGLYEARSAIDVDNPGMVGVNKAKYRASEDLLFLSGMGNDIASGLFYNNVQTNPERFGGLAPRLAATANNAANSQIIIAANGASGNQTGSTQSSIWLVGWGPDKVFGIYPKGTQAGIQQEDLGKQLVLDGQSTQKQFLAYMTRFVWKLGMCVRDWRYLVRGVNVQTGGTTGKFAASDNNISPLMTDMIAGLYSLDNCNPVFYMNRSVFSLLNKQLQNKQANLLEWIDGSESGKPGRRIPSYLGVPIKVIDAVSNTEALIS
jgi:hypothetical protein